MEAPKTEQIRRSEKAIDRNGTLRSSFNRGESDQSDTFERTAATSL
jgi:hypothetical protein